MLFNYPLSINAQIDFGNIRFSNNFNSPFLNKPILNRTPLLLGINNNFNLPREYLFPVDIGKLVYENTILKAKLIEKEKENEQLKQKIAKLSKTSKNSSKAPSTDIVKGESKKDKNGKDMKQGGQIGHPKYERTPFTPDEIDHLYEYKLKKCPDCSGQLKPCDSKKPIIIQQIEIKEIPIEISEYKGYAYWCDNCKKVHYGQIPNHIIKAGLCSSDLTALVGYMKSVLHASFSTIRKFLRDVAKIKIARSQLAKLINKVGNSLDIPYNELLERIPLEQVVNTDETGHKENGDKFWTWCFRASLYVLFKIDKSRGSDVLIEVLGKEFNGILGCDYFSAYKKYMKDFNVTVQFCLAHLIRNIRFLITFPDVETREYGKKLLELLREMFKIIRNSDNKNKEEIKYELKKTREKIVDVGINEAPGKLDENGKETKREAQNIANRFRQFGDSYFQFITTPEIDPTNNVAEQAIRFIVIDRHITQGTRSEKGRRNCERLWTVIATCSLQGRSAYDFIKTAVEAYFKGKDPPSLVPDTS